MEENEKIAVERYNKGEKYSTSSFIDDDTIIAGYGNLDYDFEYPLPKYIIEDIFGTTSWREYLKLKGLHKYKTVNKEGKVAITPYLTNEQAEQMKNDNPFFEIIQL